MGRHKQNKARRARTPREQIFGEQSFLVMEERYDDGSTFRCQWPADMLGEYIEMIMAIRDLADQRQISPHEAFLLVMHAKFPQLPAHEYIQEHDCPRDCAGWLAGKDGAADLLIPHQCPSKFDLLIKPA